MYRILTTVIVSESSDAINLDPYWSPVIIACSILIEKYIAMQLTQSRVIENFGIDLPTMYLILMFTNIFG